MKFQVIFKTFNLNFVSLSVANFRIVEKAPPASSNVWDVGTGWDGVASVMSGGSSLIEHFNFSITSQIW